MNSRKIAELFRIRSGGVADYIWRELERDPAKPQIIKTVRGACTLFAPDLL